MNNPFAKPHTLGQWLLGSVCWVASCLAGFYGSIYGVTTLWPHSGDLFGWLVFGSASLICGLMWRRVITVGWQFSLKDDSFWLVLAAGIWRLLLTFLLVASVLLITGGAIICLALSGPSAGGNTF